MTGPEQFKVLVADLGEEKGRVIDFGRPAEMLGGSGLAAALFEEFGLPGEPAHHAEQPLIFAIGPLTGYFPLMSKVVLASNRLTTGSTRKPMPADDWRWP